MIENQVKDNTKNPKITSKIVHLGYLQFIILHIGFSHA
jgi:hypothetical protein